MWDVYEPDSLKASARERRGKGTRRRVEDNTKIPSNWQEFLKINVDKVERFTLLANELVSTECKKDLFQLLVKMC